MKLLRTLSNLGIGSFFLLATITELISPQAGPALNSERPLRRALVLRTALFTLLAASLLFVIGSLLFIESGWYNLSADTPHFAPVRWALLEMRDRAVRFHSRGIVVPDVRGPSLAAHRFSLYRKNCQPCHGAPGDPGEQIGRGINPKPPRLSDGDRWAIVAFLRRMVWFSPADYKRIAAELDQGMKPADWPARDDGGFGKLGRADPRRGRDLLRSYGCVTCHESPGFGPAYVGSPLVGLAERQYIGGILVNVPSNTALGS